MTEILGAAFHGLMVWGALVFLAFLIYWPYVLAGIAASVTFSAVRSRRAGHSTWSGVFGGLAFGLLASLLALTGVVYWLLTTHFSGI